MSTDQATHAFEQRLLAEQARQKKILDDASAQAILQAQLQQQLKNLQGQLDKHSQSAKDFAVAQAGKDSAQDADANFNYARLDAANKAQDRAVKEAAILQAGKDSAQDADANFNYARLDAANKAQDRAVKEAAILQAGKDSAQDADANFNYARLDAANKAQDCINKLENDAQDAATSFGFGDITEKLVSLSNEIKCKLFGDCSQSVIVQGPEPDSSHSE
jgi:hypothetical protein